MIVAARTAIVPLLVTLGLLAADALPAQAASDAQALWERSLRSARALPHSGEVVSMSWSHSGPRVATAQVSVAPDGFTLRPEALQAKYSLTITGVDELLGRSATKLEIRRRAGAALCERLWIDDATGLLLRRERYAGHRLLALVAYERLDLEGPSMSRDPSLLEGPSMSRDPSLLEGPSMSRDLSLLEPPWRLRPALPRREATPTVDLPDELPGGYRVVGVPTAGPDGEALRAVYDDGLYRVSLFARSGRADLDALPAGATPVDGLPGAYEWPGALPPRIVRQAGETTWTLIGDAPPAELHALVRALPRPVPPTMTGRLGTGFARLWSAVSPFPQ